jgi:predicted DNA-binding transcriptional regulator AlpA
MNDEQQRSVLISNIVGLSEIAERLGVSKTAVHNWTVRHADTFPKPIAPVGKLAMVWDFAEVELWERRSRPAQGFQRGNNAQANRKDRQQLKDKETKPLPVKAGPAAPSPSKKHGTGSLWNDSKPFPPAPRAPIPENE